LGVLIRQQEVKIVAYDSEDLLQHQMSTTCSTQRSRKGRKF